MRVYIYIYTRIRFKGLGNSTKKKDTSRPIFPKIKWFKHKQT